MIISWSNIHINLGTTANFNNMSLCKRLTKSWQDNNLIGDYLQILMNTGHARYHWPMVNDAVIIIIL